MRNASPSGGGLRQTFLQAAAVAVVFAVLIVTAVIWIFHL